MRIPEFLNRDDYLQNPILRRFLKDHRISFVENRADYIREIEAYSERDERSAAEVRDWLLHVIKEGSKEICYKKVRSINEWHRDPVLLEAKIQELYPDCPRETILTYTNTAECKLIDYTLITNEENMITKIELTFSKLFLYGESGKLGNATVFPVFIEVYLDSGFIVSRAKAKSTLYEYSDMCESIAATGNYSSSRAIMILAEFEREYLNIFGQDYKRSQEYQITKRNLLDTMQTFIEQRQGRARKYARQFYHAIESHDVGFGERLRNAMVECQVIMEPFIKSKYAGALDVTIEEICDRMNTVRNGIAHSRLDLNLEAVHLSDLKIIEELLYAMRLQHLRVDTKSIQIGIKRLFGERISIE